MSYRDCLACAEAGTKPKRGKGRIITYDPQMQMPGCPNIQGHRLGAEFMAVRVWLFGLESEIEDYELEREELLVACWWAGRFGTRRMRKAFGAWAALAGRHLWYRCINIPDPPRKEESHER